jgi:hypothetical protein
MLLERVSKPADALPDCFAPLCRAFAEGGESMIARSLARCSRLTPRASAISSGVGTGFVMKWIAMTEW